MRELQAGINTSTAHNQALFEQANMAALAGYYAEAKRLLIDIYTSVGDIELCGAAAWTLGWVLVQEQKLSEAREWFARVDLGTSPLAHTLPFVQTVALGRCSTNTGTSVTVYDTSQRELPQVHVALFGRLRVSRDGEALPSCHARKATAILRYLLAKPQRQAHKDELAECMWPQAKVHEAAHSLHVAVAALRRYLGASGTDYLVFDNGTYSLAAEPTIRCDTEAFRNQLALAAHTPDAPTTVAALAGALARYTGDYFVDDRDGAWALAERERLLLDYLGALDQLGRIHVAEGRFADAAECFRLLLERDAYREDACAHLMSCFAALDRRSDALRAFEACRTALHTDLGLDPGDSLLAVWRQVVG